MSDPSLQHIHNEHLFFCCVCHQIKKLESSLDFIYHFNEKRNDNKCLIEHTLEQIETSFKEMIEWKEENSKIERVSCNYSCGVVVYVYELGTFLYDYLEKIKDKPISILQIPFTPSEVVGELTEDLEKIDFDILYPSVMCQCTFPCWHNVYLHLDGDSLNKWYSYKQMRGDEIAKYSKTLPKSRRDHFMQYKYW